jgi:hypothetical protein
MPPFTDREDGGRLFESSADDDDAIFHESHVSGCREEFLLLQVFSEMIRIFRIDVDTDA